MGSKHSRGFCKLDDEDLARLTFLGAVGEVTGSMYLLESGGVRALIDCGMYQGERRTRAANERPFPFDPRALDAVLLTHAHIDHSGLVPKLVRDGFRGKVHVTAPSAEILGILLRDSAHIHEQDAKHENRRRRRAGKRPIEPLYGLEDVERALARLVEHPFDRIDELAAGVRFRYVRAGHILGAASVECWVREETFERKVVFSGDLGRTHEPLLLPPEPPREADLVLLESTYGDRDHKLLDATIDELARALVAAAADGGNVLVPVFAVGRAQEILHYIGKLEREGRIPELPVFLDSPMAISASECYQRHSACFQRTSAGEPLEILQPRQLTLCRTPEESMRLNEQRGIVILAGSGMCDGGRIQHHLRHNLRRSTTDVVIVGFQPRGTLGRALVDGARYVRIFGESIAVAAKVNTLGGFSAHAGRSELVDWVAPLSASGARIALVHGENQKRTALATELQRRLGAIAWQPEHGASILLRKCGEPLVLQTPERSTDRRAGRAAWDDAIRGERPRARNRR